MASCLGHHPRGRPWSGPGRSNPLWALARVVIGLTVAWLVSSLAFLGWEEIIHPWDRQPFLKAIALITLLLAPCWLALHFLSLFLLPPAGRSFLSILIPTVVVSVLTVSFLTGLQSLLFDWDY